MVQPIILYDIPCTNPESKAWSPSTWKIRYALNIKGLPYKTEWVEYPDIAALSQKLGFSPTGSGRPGDPAYTVPAIYDPNTQQRVTDSKSIAKYLDKTYPASHQLFPRGTDALQGAFLDAIAETSTALFATICRTNARIFNPPSYEYWLKTRGAMLGRPYEELGTEEDWKALEAGLEKVKSWLESNEDGKGQLFMEDHIVYADVLLASMLKWTRTSDPQTWARITALHDGKWVGIAQHFSQYEQVV